MANGIDDGQRTHFSVLGFPVYVAWDFAFVVMLGLSEWRTVPEMVGWGVVVFLSILLHELGHALAYRHYGSAARIRLWGLGGLTFGSASRNRREDIITSLAGPILPLVVAGVPAYFALKAGGDMMPFEHRFLWVTLRDIYQVNVFWGLINLLPVLPLDGGNVANALFGRSVARITSIVTGVVVAAVAYQGYGEGRLAVLALLLAGYNAYIYRKEREIGIDRISGYGELPGGGSPPDRDDVDRHRPAPGRPSGWKPGSRPNASEVDAWQALERGDVKRATELVGRMKGTASPMLAGAVLARNGREAGAVAAFGSGFVPGANWPPVAFAVLADSGLAGAVAEWVVSTDPGHGRALLDRFADQLRHGGHASAVAEVVEVVARTTRWGPDIGRSWYTAACAWADAGDPERAVTALEQALRSGLEDVEMVRLEPSFAGLHGRPGFDCLLNPPDAVQ
jgi:Zn-dependent protease